MKFLLEEPHFEFDGFASRGECFLRVQQVNDGRYNFLCVQREDYSGTSITNAVETIFSAAVEELAERGAIPEHLRPSFFTREKRKHLLLNVAKNSRWIEHYPPGVGLAPNGSWALVSFDKNLSPLWEYMSRGSLMKNLGITDEFLAISDYRVRP